MTIHPTDVMIYVFLTHSLNHKYADPQLPQPSISLMPSGQRHQYYCKWNINYIHKQPALVTLVSLLATLLSDDSIFARYPKFASFYDTVALQGNTAKHEQLQGVHVVNKMLFRRTIRI